MLHGLSDFAKVNRGEDTLYRKGCFVSFLVLADLEVSLDSFHPPFRAYFYRSGDAARSETSHDGVEGGRECHRREIYLYGRVYIYMASDAIETRASGAHHRPMKNPAFPDERRYLCVPLARPSRSCYARRRPLSSAWQFYDRTDLHGFRDGSIQTRIPLR